MENISILSSSLAGRFYIVRPGEGAVGAAVVKAGPGDGAPALIHLPHRVQLANLRSEVAILLLLRPLLPLLQPDGDGVGLQVEPLGFHQVRGPRFPA